MNQIAAWRWNHITNQWEKEPAVVNTIRLVAVGQVAAGAHKLYWVTICPFAANWGIEVSDDTTGLTATVWDAWDDLKSSFHVVLSPPMNFTTGIYLKAMGNPVAVTFGYI